jgi:hypothetical protein
MADVKRTIENDGAGTGIFINEGTIFSARSISNEDIYKNGQPVDIGLEFELEIGKDFKPKFSVSGNFKKNEATGNWDESSTVKVKIALANLKVKWTKLNPDNSIPQDVLDQCIGKTIVRLQYPYKISEKTGKPQHKTFDYFLLASEPNAKARVKAKYEEAVAKGYVKPLADNATSFPGPAAPEPVQEEKVF